MQTDKNFKTKDDLIRAIKAGKRVRVHIPGTKGSQVQSGTVMVEGKYGRWQAACTVKDGAITEVK